MNHHATISPPGSEPVIAMPELPIVPAPRSRRSSAGFWWTLALMILGVCIPPDLYAVNLFFIGCPVHRVLNTIILRYLLNLSLALAIAAVATALVGIPLHLRHRRVMRARELLFAGE
jgi:hypothetical protein